MDKYRVALTAEERAGMEHLVSVGKGAARKLTHARILLLADTAAGGGHSDDEIVAALDVGHLHRRSCPQALGHRRSPCGYQPQTATAATGQDQDQREPRTEADPTGVQRSP